MMSSILALPALSTPHTLPTLPTSAIRSPQTTSPPDEGIQLRQTHARDVDEHVEQLHDWELRYEQLDCGRFEGHFTDIRWPGVQLFIERTTRRVRQRGHLPAQCFSVGTMIEGQGDVSVNAVRAGIGALITVDGTQLDICTPPDCTLAGVVIDAGLAREAMEHVIDLPRPCGAGTLGASTPTEPAQQRWHQFLLACATRLAAQPELLSDGAMRERLQQDLFDQLIEVLSASSPEERVTGIDYRQRVVDRACDMMLASPDAPPSLAEVCHRLGTSLRKLSYCFQDVLGISPARYAKAVRLNAVRRALARCEDSAVSVYDIAAHWGFWHFGHFSSDYKRQFEELPSETLRHARQRFKH